MVGSSPYDRKESDMTERLPFTWVIQSCKMSGDFPRGPVVKILPANAVDMGSVPNPGFDFQ